MVSTPLGGRSMMNMVAIIRRDGNRGVHKVRVIWLRLLGIVVEYSTTSRLL